MLEELVLKKDLKKYVGWSPQHIAREEKAGRFPLRVKVGASRVAWLKSELISCRF